MKNPADTAKKALQSPTRAKKARADLCPASTPKKATARKINSHKHYTGGAVLPVQMPAVFQKLFTPHRYKIFYGGRGGAKSWSFADALITLALQKCVRVLCARELQVSINDSVYRLLVDRISKRGLAKYFVITTTSIKASTGSEFIFKGIRHNVNEIKSLEGIDICWVEEAQRVSKESWDLLIPTIRKEGSEIWISFNPRTPHDETYIRFVENTPSSALLRKVGWQDNPWMSKTLHAERLECLARSPEEYAHIWEGNPRVITAALVFAGKYSVRAFDTPSGIRLLYGADWGFAEDPTVLTRSFVVGDTLFVDYEAWQQGIALEDLHILFDQIPDARRWPISADSSRPEIIKSVRRRGFIIKPCKKWPGSVEDGITIMRGFREIVLHPRCVKTIEEFSKYSYKTDSLTEEVLPILVDKHNHCIDALRYGGEPYIRGKLKKDKK